MVQCLLQCPNSLPNASSGEHGQNLICLEAKYAAYGREMQSGFEDLIKTNENIEKRLRRAVYDHDKHGLSKKMPIKLATRPKMLQKLLA